MCRRHLHILFELKIKDFTSLFEATSRLFQHLPLSLDIHRIHSKSILLFNLFTNFGGMPLGLFRFYGIQVRIDDVLFRLLFFGASPKEMTMCVAI